jgi:hypothetical protein
VHLIAPLDVGTVAIHVVATIIPAIGRQWVAFDLRASAIFDRGTAIVGWPIYVARTLGRGNRNVTSGSFALDAGCRVCLDFIRRALNGTGRWSLLLHGGRRILRWRVVVGVLSANHASRREQQSRQSIKEGLSHR